MNSVTKLIAGLRKLSLSPGTIRINGDLSRSLTTGQTAACRQVVVKHTETDRSLPRKSIRHINGTLTVVAQTSAIFNPSGVNNSCRRMMHSNAAGIIIPRLSNTGGASTLLKWTWAGLPQQQQHQQQQRRGMANLYQMHLTGPHRKKRPPRKPLDGAPMLKGVVLKTLVKKPKKPNSANRKCVLVRLSNGKEKVAYVPGIGHNLQEHNIVMVRVGRLRDVPGVKLKCIRGKYDLPHVQKQAK